MSERISLVVGAEEVGRRLDAFVAAAVPQMSRTRARTLIEEGHVRVNGRESKPARKVDPGDTVVVDVVPLPPLSAGPESIPLDVVYSDSDLAVIDKPAGLVVHPAPGHSSGTLANALAALYPSSREVGGEERPGIVHRLDKDTSGLMVVALTPGAYRSLQSQIASRTAERRYLALAPGTVEPRQGTIRAAIGRDQRDRKRMAVDGVAARAAETSYRVLEEFPGFSLLEARLHTGRTHQIRVHLAAIGHPLAGDSTYGGPSVEGLHRQFLHAYRLDITSPSTGQRLEFESPLPADLRAVLDGLR